MVTTIKQELLRLVDLNLKEQWVAPHIAISQLQRYGDRLIPGLIASTSDADDQVRILAIELLAATESRSQAILSALIERLSDEDRLVRGAAALSLAEFGKRAIAAVPILLPWLEDKHEYVRLLAATTILRIDSTRSHSLLPIVTANLGSENAAVSGFAEDFFATQKPC